jgi:hypothetical protein
VKRRAFASPTWWLGLCLVAIGGLALGARLWGIGFGLPNEAARPDERHLIGYTLSMAASRGNPHFFNYPSLYLNLLLVFYAVYFVAGRLTGHFSSPSDLAAEYALDPRNLYLIDRVVVALLGTATVYLVFLIGKRAFNRRVGILGGLMLSVAYLHVRESHFGTVDVPLTFFVTLAMAAIVRADSERRDRLFWLAGFASGLAVSTKYNAVALLAPLALIHVAPARSDETRGAAWVRRFAGTMMAVAAGFLVGTPYALLDHRKFLADATFELMAKSNGRPAVDLGWGWIYHLRQTLPGGLGIPLLIAAAAGMIVGWRQHRRAAIILGAFPVAWWIGIGLSHYVYLRYAVPLVPAICLFAALGVDGSLTRLAALVESRKRAALVWCGTAVLMATVMAVPAYRSLQWDRLIARPDTRVLAARWIDSHVPPSTVIGLVGPEYIWPQLWNAPAQLQLYMSSAEAQESRGRRLRAELRKAYVERTGVETDQTDRSSWPAWVVMAQHPAWHPPAGALPSLDASYIQVASFQGGADEDALYDMQDAFYFPFSGFSGVVRPGPTLSIYRRSK